MPDPSLRESQLSMKVRILAGDPEDERLSVYSGGYLARIQEALEEAYPAVRHVAGANSFHALAHDYAARHPSHSYNLSWAGLHLPEFLPTHELGQELAFLPDLARLEWQVVESFHAFDQEPMDTAGLASVPPENWARTRLFFQPSVRVVASDWPVLDIWEARNRPVSEVRVELANRPQRVLIYRKSLLVRCELLEEAQFQLLDDLLNGQTLGDACSKLLDSPTEEDPPLVDWFSRWAAAGLVVNINLA